MQKPRTFRFIVRFFVIEALLASMMTIGSGVAQASTTCGVSNGHTLCVTVPDTPLTGPAAITVTNNANNGTVIATWIPSGKPAINLLTKFVPSPQTNDYSFVWPTQKYLDASGVLRLQHGSTGSSQVNVSVTLSNGNATDFQHSPNDWANFLPAPWTQPTDPVVAAVGDGPDDGPEPNALAQSIALSDPDLFLFLGDIYENGTFVENLNHYGQNSMDGGSGTLWGRMGTFTQPTLGNHEVANTAAWQDYFHGRPLYTSFRFGNVLFLDLASSGPSMAVGSAQYNYVKGILTSTTNPPPPCIVGFWHIPALNASSINSKFLPMWSLLANNGGDLVLNGHKHTMIQYKPLNDQLQLPSAGQASMVELINGAGGHTLGGTFTGDARVDWSKGKTPGGVYLTLNDAANGGTPNSISWTYKDKNLNTLHAGSRTCGAAAPASITGFSPGTGPVGTSVAIDGSGFTGTTDVKFNGTSVGSGNFTVNSNILITATVPSGATTGPISVTTPGGTATSFNAFTVTASPQPTITGFNPPSGPVGTSVTIDGSGFSGTTDVKFDGTSVGSGNFTVSSDIQINATVPFGASTGPISVTTPGGTGTSSSPFTVTASSHPTITGFNPPSGPVGTSVTIDGSGFTGTTDVKFDGTSVGSGNFTVVSDAQITATVPSGAASGPISVTTPGGTATSSGAFAVVLTFGPVADTYVRSDNPTATFGSKTSLSVDNSPIKHGLLKFTVSGVGTNSIQSVRLRLFCVDDSSKGGDFYWVPDNSWLENTVTWSSEPAADPTLHASLGAVSVNSWYEVDLSSLVTGDGTYSIRIASTSSNGADYSTKEGPAGSASQLIVTLA